MVPGVDALTRTKALAIVGLLLAVFAADRLTHVPSSTVLRFDADRLWTVPVGHELVLHGPETRELFQIETAAGDGIRLEAGPVRLAPGGERVDKLTWLVSRPESGGASDNKVNLTVALARGDPAATVTLERSGAETQPELLLGSANAPLEVDAGLVFGDLRRLPATAVLADGKPTVGPAIALRFTLLAGGDMAMTFPTFADGTPKGLTIAVGAQERRGPRLWLRELGVRQEEAERPRLTACAALPDRTLWATLLRRSSIAGGGDCDGGRRLALTSLAIKTDTIVAGLAGSAYLHDRDQPTFNRYFQWAGDNPVLGLMIATILTAYVTWIVRLFTVPKP